MEAAAVTVILKLVVNKLAPLVIKEYSSIVRVKKDLQDLHGLATEINNRLEAGGGKAEGNWLKKLKDVCYDLDNIVDEFQLEAEKHAADAEGGFLSKTLLAKLKSVKHQCTAASKIKEVKKRFAEIVKQRTDVTAIVNCLPVAHSTHHADQTSLELPFPIAGKTSVIGREEEKAKIITKLVETKDQQKIEIVSIIGLGGSGKTTLAYLVYNDGDIIKKHFHVRLWVRVSQESNVQKLVENLFEAITKCRSDQYPLTHMSETILNELTGKRFLLVLDNVWAEDRSQWEKFMVLLENCDPKSKILLTTRCRTVAEAVESTYLFDLPLLCPDDSWQLFHRSFGAGLVGLSSEFQDVGKEIVRKCGGVPLAIKVIAGVLRGKKRIEQWKTVRDSSLLYVQGKENEIYECLKLSYFHLPSHLKPCFAICSLFPKGYMFDKEQLIDLWIAHDMIAMEEGISYLECTAEGYFNSLVQMSFLQNVEDGKDGSVAYGMHDLVHDLARSILGDEISLVVPKEVTKSYRYFSLIKQPENSVPIIEHLENDIPVEVQENPIPKGIFGKARAVYFAMRSDSIDSMALEHAKHLRSVIVGSPSASVPKTMFQIKYLKYLAMSRLGCKVLPDAISDLWNLQALHLTNSVDLEDIPESIGKLKKLRTLNLSRCRCLRSLPESIGDCPMISIINLSYCDDLKELPNSIGKNTRLRVLNLGYTKFERLPSSITKLENLECLDLRWCSELRELPEDIDNLKKLEVMNLEGCEALKCTLEEIGQLRCIQNVSIHVVGQGKRSDFRQYAQTNGLYQASRATYVMETDDSGEACLLRQRTSLKFLEVHFDRTVKMGQPILDALVPPPGIQDLYITEYTGEEYAKWMLKQVGARVDGVRLFTCLTVMRLSSFRKLKHLEGLVELPCLENLELLNMPFLERISGGPFPSLTKLVLAYLPSLGDVWMITERTLSGGEESHMQIGTCLSDLQIVGCPKLTVKPHIPVSLEHLLLLRSNHQLLQSPAQGEVYTSSSSPASFTYRHLKELEVRGIKGLSSSRPVLSGHGHDFGLLGHMTALESLTIQDCNSLTELPDGIGSCTSLRLLDIRSCYGIRMLPESLGQMQSLQQFDIWSCHALEKLPESLGELCSLRRLIINRSNELTCFPQFISGLTSLEELTIIGCPRIESLPEGIKGLIALQHLSISDCVRLCSLPESMGHLTSLQVLKIYNCPAIHQLPYCMGQLRSLRKFSITSSPGLTSLPPSMCRLTSLEELLIDICPAIHQLPDCMGELCSIRTFKISSLPGLTSLPQSMSGLTSLEELLIDNCPGIKSLPEWIKSLTALRRLWIRGCPDLERRCERGKGEDWHLISRIPRVHFGSKDDILP